MQRELGVGVIGVGHMGQRHARTISELPQSRLIAVADVNATLAKSVASRYRAEAEYSDYKKLLNREDVDAVVIATPDHLHRDAAVYSAEMGKHILLEKPIASTLEDSDAIIKAARKAGVKLMVGHILRFDASYAKVKQAIEGGMIGEPILALSNWRIPTSSVERMGGRVPITLWLCVHDFDLILWYIQDRPITVYASAVNRGIYNKFKVSDLVCALVKFERGGVAIVDASWTLPHEAISKMPIGWERMSSVEMEVVGTEGTVKVKCPATTVMGVDKTGVKFPDVTSWPEIHGKIAGALRFEDSHFIECIIKDSEPIIGGHEGRRALELALAANRSIETNKVVELPLR